MIEIDLARGHAADACRAIAEPLYTQLGGEYRRGMSTMSLSGTFDEYLEAHRTARKRAARSERLGYHFAKIDRSYFKDDVWAINTSTPERQGRPMTEAYRERPSFGPNPLECPLHHVYTYGVFRRGRLPDGCRHLVAYLWLYRSGDLALISSILGHADYLAGDVMYLLATQAIRDQIWRGGTLVYNRHASGTDGLRYFKERLGLQPTEVSWKL